MGDQLEIKVLGSGTSSGVPVIGCDCSVCSSSFPKDKRLRSSLYISYRGQSLLIDTGPDLRSQALREGIADVDRVFITHAHADHLHGLDDLRPFSTFKKIKTSLPVFASSGVCQDIKLRFNYIFNRDALSKAGGGVPLLELKEIDQNSQVRLLGETGPNFSFFPLPHYRTTTWGLATEGFAYLIDCVNIPAETVRELKSRRLDLLIIDCLQITDHMTHLTLSKALSFIEQIAPKRAGLIHMGHQLQHAWLEKKALKASKSSHIEIFPTFDGQKLLSNP